MKAAFVCWRPYQVFNAINMVYNDTEGTKGNSDLYIQDIPSLVAMLPHLEKLNLFKHIYLFSELNHGDTMDISKMRMLEIYTVRTWNFIFSHSALKRNCREYPDGGFKQYDLLLASGWISFFMELANCNPNARVVMFEDGTGTYNSDQLKTLPAIRKVYYGVLKTLFHKGPLCIPVSALYVNNIELMVGDRDYPVYNLAKIDDGLFKLLCQTFNFDEDDRTYQNKRFVFLGQPLTQENIQEYDELRLVKSLSDLPGIIYRKHPLQRDLEFLEIEDRKRPMWELACRQLNNDVTLIAPFSTAQMTPKILYNYEPRIIFLYKISFRPDSETLVIIQNLVEQFKKTYRNEIYEPSSLEELHAIIDEINGETEHVETLGE